MLALVRLDGTHPREKKCLAEDAIVDPNFSLPQHLSSRGVLVGDDLATRCSQRRDFEGAKSLLAGKGSDHQIVNSATLLALALERIEAQWSQCLFPVTCTSPSDTVGGFEW